MKVTYVTESGIAYPTKEQAARREFLEEIAQELSTRAPNEIALITLLETLDTIPGISLVDIREVPA
jgi:hypothetical protein